MKEFDLIVIGGGSGGIATANQAAKLGANVLLIEKNKLGGTCVNVGCVPKKIMWTAASLMEQQHDLSYYGLECKGLKFDWGTLVKNREAYIERLNGLYEKGLESNGVTFIHGEANVTSEHTVEVNEKTFHGKHILIATGCEPITPDISGSELGITSDGFFELKTLPKKVAIVGSGYIAVELAGVLNALGSDVTLVIRKERVLRNFDTMLSEQLMQHMEKTGIKIYKKHTPTQLIRDKANKLSLYCQGCTNLENLDCVIWSIGRQTVRSHIGLTVGLDSNNFISTNKEDQTNIPSVYAVGDVTGHVQLTPVAIKAGRYLARRLFNKEKLYVNYNLVPTVVFSHPPIATVGLCETEACEKYGKDNLKIYESTFAPMYYGMHDKDDKVRTSIKLITQGSDEKIVGCHMIGLDVDEILQGFAVAIQMGATKQDFDAVIPIHPTSAEELVTLK